MDGSGDVLNQIIEFWHVGDHITDGTVKDGSSSVLIQQAVVLAEALEITTKERSLHGQVVYYSRLGHVHIPYPGKIRIRLGIVDDDSIGMLLFVQGSYGF